MTLRPLHIHISRLLLTAIAIISGGIDTYSQQIEFPQRWLQQMSDIPDLFNRDTLTICVAGDVMMHSRQIEDALLPDGTYSFSCFDKIKDRIAAADIAVANMEFTLAGRPYAGYPMFSAPESYADYMVECGFDIFLTANNHILDRGSKGAARTLGIYKDLEDTHGIRYTGSATDPKDSALRNPLILQKKGFRLALTNFTYGTNLGRTEEWPEINYIGERQKRHNMAQAAESKGAEILIAFPHWGNEYQLQHSESQEKTADELVEEGVDLIIGAHPHVAQDFRMVGQKNVPVAYSLGNAVSNMSAPNTQIGLLATVRLTRDENGDVEMLPLEFTYLWCSRPGGYTDTFMVLPVKEFIGTRDEWKGRWEYDKMIDTYYRVMQETGITE